MLFQTRQRILLCSNGNHLFSRGGGRSLKKPQEATHGTGLHIRFGGYRRMIIVLVLVLVLGGIDIASKGIAPHVPVLEYSRDCVVRVQVGERDTRSGVYVWRL